MTTPIPYAFEGTNVRIIDTDGAPWFVLSDVCRVLDISHGASSARLLDEDEKGVHTVHTPGGDQSTTTINESGLYSLILRSRKPAAKRFKKWVTSEVLPAIRQTGRYDTDGSLMPGDDGFGDAVLLVREARHIGGSEAAATVWAQVGLPSPPNPRRLSAKAPGRKPGRPPGPASKHPIDGIWFKVKLMERGHSLRDLARYLGADPSSISRMFAGKRVMQMKEAEQIAKFLDISLSDVLAHVGIRDPKAAISMNDPNMKIVR